MVYAYSAPWVIVWGCEERGASKLKTFGLCPCRYGSNMFKRYLPLACSTDRLRPRILRSKTTNWRFPKIGLPPVIIRFYWDFPWNKPSSYRGTPPLEGTCTWEPELVRAAIPSEFQRQEIDDPNVTRQTSASRVDMFGISMDMYRLYV